jgi:hypothetical protein
MFSVCLIQGTTTAVLPSADCERVCCDYVFVFMHTPAICVQAATWHICPRVAMKDISWLREEIDHTFLVGRLSSSNPTCTRARVCAGMQLHAAGPHGHGQAAADTASKCNTDAKARRARITHCCWEATESIWCRQLQRQSLYDRPRRPLFGTLPSPLRTQHP